MGQINLHSLSPDVTDLWAKGYDDAERDVPITAVRLPDCWVLRIDDGDPSTGGLNLRLRANGHQEWNGRALLPGVGQVEGPVVVLEPSAAPFPRGPKRAPLGPFPVGSFDRTLPFTPPAGRDLLFYRGNFCGIRVPGAPGVLDGPNATVPGGDTSLVMTCLLDRYPVDIQHRFLDIYSRWYTHIQLSIGHSAYFGRSIDQYVETAKLAQSYGLFADHWFLGGGPGDRSGPFQKRDQDVTYWKPLLDPWIDALIAAKVIDAGCIGWQLDQYNVPGAPIESIIDYIAGRLVPQGVPIGTHWVNEAGGWWVAPGDRFTWWRDFCRGKVTWFHHQGDVNMSIPEYQAKLCDTLNPFGDGRMGTSGLFGDRPYSLVVYECSAQNQYDGVTNEDEGDQRGYLLSCTNASSHVGGYGNGARMPDGGVL